MSTLHKRLALWATVIGLVGALLGGFTAYTIGTLTTGEKLGRWAAALERLETTFPVVEAHGQTLVAQGVMLDALKDRIAALEKR